MVVKTCFVAFKYLLCSIIAHISHISIYVVFDDFLCPKFEQKFLGRPIRRSTKWSPEPSVGPRMKKEIWSVQVIFQVETENSGGRNFLQPEAMQCSHINLRSRRRMLKKRANFFSWSPTYYV
jgi:hypothetical protein